MALRTILFSAAALVAVPASASVIVIGGSFARQCYEAAESPLRAAPEELEACDTALRTEPLTERDTAATHINRGILRVRAGRLEEGLADFDRAIAIDPSIAEAWFNRGVTLLRRRSPEEALPTFTAALERPTTRPALIYYGRGVAHEALGDVRAAYEDYRRASQLEPEWQRPRAELSRFTVRSN
ncbi:MAG: tetratricopeptide repeat protein [Pseudomonadota bacterium]|nr:tetratricopeptide repeat protein [Pseudomonadota bacterium]